MNETSNANLHRHTPALNAIDGRGLAVRQVAYLSAEQTAHPASRISTAQHDAAGRLVAQRDPRFFSTASRPNQVALYSHSGAALLTDSVDAGWRLSLAGESGEVLEHWDGRGSHWQNQYDELRRPIAIHERMSGRDWRTVERLTYADSSLGFAERNQCGSLVRHDDPAGTLWLKQVALTGELIRQTRCFLPDQSHLSADWPAIEAARDSLLQPGDGYTSESRHSPAGEVLEQIDAGGHRQQFAFNCAGQLQRIDLTLKGQAPQPLLKAADYSAAGQLRRQVTGNDVISIALYQVADGRLERLTTSTSARRNLQEMSYQYDPVGNILRQVDHTQADSYFDNQRVAAENTYTYDSLYQLTGAEGRETAGAGLTPGLPELSIPSPIDPARLLNFSECYRYDAGGNRTLLRHESTRNPFHRRLYVDPQSNRALPWNEGADAPDFSRHFDSNGNLQYLVPGAQAMTWDARNQLQGIINVQRSNGINDGEWYRYSAAGQRVVKLSTRLAQALTHQQIVHYLPDLQVRSVDEREALQVIHAQLPRGSVQCLHWVKGPPDGIANDQLRYSVDDHLGSSCLELDQRAAVISHEGYYPYGGTAWWAGRSKIEADYRILRYSGKERDATGLYDYGYRYYAPWLGRWINPDPAGSVDGLNLYCMVRNNPVKFRDWMGLASDSEDRTLPSLKRRKDQDSDRRRKVRLRDKMDLLFGESPPSSAHPSRQSQDKPSTSSSFRPYDNPRPSQSADRRNPMPVSQPGRSRPAASLASSSSATAFPHEIATGGRQKRLPTEAFTGEKSDLTTPAQASNIYFHYTTGKGHAAIRSNWMLNPSSKELDGTTDKKIGRHYFTDLAPETQSQKQTSEAIFGIRKHGNYMDKMTHYFEINTQGLELTKAADNPHIAFLPTPFSIPLQYVSHTGQRMTRIISHGETLTRAHRSLR